jgi:hypothetical protein
MEPAITGHLDHSDTGANLSDRATNGTISIPEVDPENETVG